MTEPTDPERPDPEQLDHPERLEPSEPTGAVWPGAEVLSSEWDDVLEPGRSSSGSIEAHGLAGHAVATLVRPTDTDPIARAASAGSACISAITSCNWSRKPKAPPDW